MKFKIVILLCLILLCSCNHNDKDESSCNCGDQKFNMAYLTTDDFSNVDSVIIRKYVKNDSFNRVVLTYKNKLIHKSISLQEGTKDSTCSFILNDSLDSHYDYRFQFIGKPDTFKFDLSEITFRSVTFGRILKPGEPSSKVPLTHACMLGHWKVNGIPSRESEGNIHFGSIPGHSR